MCKETLSMSKGLVKSSRNNPICTAIRLSFIRKMEVNEGLKCDLHLYKSYRMHANLYGIILPSYF